MAASSPANNGNGKITLAVLQVQMETLTKALEQHDSRGREDMQHLYERLDRDHDSLIETKGRVGALETAHGELVRQVSHQQREARILGGVANVVAAVATALASIVRIH